MNNDQIQHTIEQYHQGVLEQAQFDTLLNTSPELKAAYQSYQEELNLIEALAQIELRKEAEKAYQKNALKKKLILAVITLSLIALAFILLKRSQHNTVPSPNALYAMHYEPMSIPALRSTPNETVLWRSYLDAYQNKEFEKVVTISPEVSALNEGIDINLAMLILGVSQLEMGDYSKAKATFQQISDESIYVQEKTWYSALCLVKLNDYTAALALFENIVATQNHFKNDQASVFVQSIKDTLND